MIKFLSLSFFCVFSWTLLNEFLFSPFSFVSWYFLTIFLIFLEFAFWRSVRIFLTILFCGALPSGVFYFFFLFVFVKVFCIFSFSIFGLLLEVFLSSLPNLISYGASWLLTFFEIGLRNSFFQGPRLNFLQVFMNISSQFLI